MLHYYFLKYWSRTIVGVMVGIVISYFGVFSYSLSAEQRSEQSMREAQLSVTPPITQLIKKDPRLSQNTYKKSVTLFQEIQKLKDKNQDTVKLETLYADSVKNLSNQNEKKAENQLIELETQIAKIYESLVTPTPQPSGIVVSGTPAPSIEPSPSESELKLREATSSARIQFEDVNAN